MTNTTSLNFNPIPVKIKALYEDTVLPFKAHPSDACFDISAHIEGKKNWGIAPQKCRMIPTGFATEIPEGYCALVFSRSGLGGAEGLRVAQGVGVIDSSYRGEWIVPLYNDNKCPKQIRNKLRIAQFMIVPVWAVQLIQVDELSKTDRGTGGFGSTGK